MKKANKVVLITGGARRMGKAISEFLWQRGMSVAIHCHTAITEAEQLAKQLNAMRANSAMVIPLNLVEIDHYEQIVTAVLKQWGRLDVLINNASIFYPTCFSETSIETFETMLAVNLKAPFFLAKAALTPLQANSGCIINITDIHAQKPLKFYSAYTISKAGLKMMTESLARELAPHIRVNAVAPGAILWPEKNLDAEKQKKIIEKIPLKHNGQPMDIAQAVGFLIDSAYITGQTIVIDGGRLLD